MKKITRPLLILFVTLAAAVAACSSETGVSGLLSTITPTPQGTSENNNIYDLGVTLAVNEMEAMLTKQAIDNDADVLSIRMTATAWPSVATATRHAEIAAAESQAAAIRATDAFNATSIKSTEVFSATQFSWTQTVYANTLAADQLIGTQRALETAAVLPVYQQNEIAELRAQETIAVGNAEQVALAVRRQQIKNTADAVLPWTLIVAVTLTVAFFGYLMLQTTAYSRDASGSFRTLTIAHKKGKTVVRPDLMKSPTLTVRRTGEVESPEPTETDKEVTRRSQLVDALRAIPAVQQFAKTAKSMFDAVFGTRSRREVPQVNLADLGAAFDEAVSRFDQEAE